MLACLRSSPSIFTRRGLSTLSSDDKCLISETIIKCMHFMDSGSGDEFADLFTENGKCEITKLNQSVQGRENLKALCMGIHEKFEGTQHWEGNVLISVDGNGSVLNKSYWKAINGGSIVSMGLHDDVLVKEGNVWKFRHRKIIHTWVKN